MKHATIKKYIHTYIHTYSHTHIHTHTRTYIHTHTHTHTHKTEVSNQRGWTGRVIVHVCGTSNVYRI
jgi:hypothetical protein